MGRIVVNSDHVRTRIIDHRFRVAVGMAGYRWGLSCHEGVATDQSDPLALPRIEVSGWWDLDQFAATVRRHAGAQPDRFAA